MRRWPASALTTGRYISRFSGNLPLWSLISPRTLIPELCAEISARHWAHGDCRLFIYVLAASPSALLSSYGACQRSPWMMKPCGILVGRDICPGEAARRSPVVCDWSWSVTLLAVPRTTSFFLHNNLSHVCWGMMAAYPLCAKAPFSCVKLRKSPRPPCCWHSMVYLKFEFFCPQFQDLWCSSFISVSYSSRDTKCNPRQVSK